MRFWDASALVPLVLEEEMTSAIRKVYRDDPRLAVWCLTPVEIESALSRRSREGLEAVGVDRVRTDLRTLSEKWAEIVSLDVVRSRATRLLHTHLLRAADALQLAAALVVCDERPESLSFVCLDDRLREAARKEGFPVLPS
jgi:hypothetical protein